MLNLVQHQSFKKCVSLQDGFRAKHGMTHFNIF
jgi:hypothetical protein